MDRFATFTTLGLATLLATGASASGQSTIEAQAGAQSLRSEGISLLSADLMALLQENLEEPKSPADFLLTAPAVVVEKTVRDPTAHAGGVTVGLDSETDSQEFHAVQVTGLKARLDDRLDVFALPHRAAPHLHAETGCSAWSSPGQGDVHRDARIPTRAPRAVSVRVADGARVSDCGATDRWVVTGDFVVLVWERDAQLQSAEGKQSLRSGRMGMGSSVQGGARAGQDDGTQAASREQELYLYVSGGRLEIPMDARTLAYLAPQATLSGAAAMDLGDASFQVGADSMPVHAGRLRLEGSLDLRLGPTSQRLLDLHLHGDLVSGQADGTPFGGHSAASVAPAKSSNGPSAGLTAAGAAASAVVAAASLRHRRRSKAIAARAAAAGALGSGLETLRHPAP